MPKVTVITVAYNAEKTLRRTIKSVLAQTERDFQYVIVDHGSTDNTRKLILNFVRKDSRITGVYDDSNRAVGGVLAHMVDSIKNATSRWVVILDADDEYHPAFLQNTIGFAESQALDMVCCGSNFIDQASGKVCGRRATNGVLTVDTPAAFSEFMPLYHQFMRTWWAKLISVEALKKCDWSWISRDEVTDTRFAFECLSHCERFAIIPDVLHNYYVYQSSSHKIVRSEEHQVDLRIRGDRRINQFISKVLIEKCGQVTPRNEDFLLVVYMNALKDLFSILINAQIPASEKITGLHQMFVCDDARRLAESRFLGTYIGTPVCSAQRDKFFTEVADWLIAQVKQDTSNITGQILDILAVLGEVHLKRLTERSPLLLVVTPQSATFLKNSIAAILRGDLEAALEEILLLADDEIPNEHAECYLLLAEYVCAAMEYAEGWIFFKKEYIRFLQDCGRSNVAKIALTELAGLLPNDQEIQEIIKNEL